MFWKDRVKNISVVCQGAVEHPVTKECLVALRNVFPKAELILSTWTGTDISGLPYDKVVFSSDPGAVYCDTVTQTLNNVNRQLVSTQAGLIAATRPYILKTRTDILFQDAEFLSYFAKYDRVPSANFQNRLLICNYYTRNPRVFSTCFHPSDWIVFGRAEDVRGYYAGTPLMTAEEGVWFHSRCKQSTFFTNYISRFTPEQHIFLGFLRQHRPVACDCYYDRTPALVKETERAFAECFVVLDYGKQLPITFTKYNPNRYLERGTLISHWQWKALYRHYCRGGFSPLWPIYLLHAARRRTLTGIRTRCIRCLDRLGWKEAVKGILSKLSAGRAER